jgi:Mn-containing catalase
MPQFTNVYFNMSNGDATRDMRGPWNNEPLFDYRQAEPAVDGGSGLPEVKLQSNEAQVVEQLALRIRSDPNSDPTTGAELGMAGAADPTEASMTAAAAGSRRGKTTGTVPGQTDGSSTTP